MTESKAQPPAPAPTKPPCADAATPYTRYRVAVAVAAKRSELSTADKEKIDERYNKLAGAQKLFEDKWNAQKKPWENLKCQLERILKALHGAVDEQQRKHLRDCWCELKDPGEDPKQVDCSKLKCEDPECKEELPDIGDLRRWETDAEDCVKRYDKVFDDLAKLPDDIEQKITDLAADATKIEDAIAAPGNDPLRSYVAYLVLEWSFRELWKKLRMTPAEYACKLKQAFVDLLDMHRKLICLQVAIHKWTVKKSYADAEDQAGNIVDRVLEECPPSSTPTKPTEPAKPCTWETECPDEPSKPPTGYEPSEPPKDYGEGRPSGGGGSEPGPAGANC
jgi:hypothetical protein